MQLEHHAPGCARMLIDGKPFREIESNCWDPKRRLEECDACAVDVQVLSTVPVMFSYWAKPADGHDLSRLLNDHLAMVAARTPQRFVALGTLPMQAPDLACRELERCVRELGFAGVQIGTHVNGWNLDQPELFPVFERAQALTPRSWCILGTRSARSAWSATFFSGWWECPRKPLSPSAP
jgi:aminocarboxymuconate-semialdehyde decarboxylase